jgi:LysM repeat protein
MALDLGKQVGPLPLGAWIAVVGGGLAIGWYFSSNTATSSSKAAESPVPLTESGVGVGGGQFIYDPPTQVETPNTAITTNAEWSRKAQNSLISKGYDPGTVVSAITKFITGQNRTTLEQFLVNMALMEFGAPPDDVPIPEITAPQPKPPTTPPRNVPPLPMTVARGETIGIISARYKTSWWNIYIANDKLGLRPDGSQGILTGPYAIKPGMRLVIPTKASGTLTEPPATKAGPLRYHTVKTGETLTTIGAKYRVHPSTIFTANDVVGRRADGSAGFMRTPTSLKAGWRLIIPYN